MNREQFISELESSLHRLASLERTDILRDFEEHFTIGLDRGETEEGIAAALGSPQKIAKELLATYLPTYHLEKVETKASTGNIFRAVWAVIGLGFFNLIIVLGPFIALLGILLSGWLVGFIASPLLILIDTVIHPSRFELFGLFLSITLAGLGLFIAVGMFVVTRKFKNGFVRYLTFNVKFVKGGMKHA